MSQVIPVMENNTLQANRKGRLPFIPGYCERRPQWLIKAQASVDIRLRLHSNTASAKP